MTLMPQRWTTFFAAAVLVFVMVGCGSSSSPVAPSTPYVPKANIMQSTDPETGYRSYIWSNGRIDVWGKNTGSGCANNIQYELITYEEGGGTFATRGAQLDSLTGWHSGTVYSGDTFKITNYQADALARLYRNASDSGDGEDFDWWTRLTFTWTDIACP